MKKTRQFVCIALVVVYSALSNTSGLDFATKIFRPTRSSVYHDRFREVISDGIGPLSERGTEALIDITLRQINMLSPGDLELSSSRLRYAGGQDPAMSLRAANLRKLLRDVIRHKHGRNESSRRDNSPTNSGPDAEMDIEHDYE